ncbi:hypothetical protein FUAX_49200 (plasmid) [Fulvitalea axinellae]|uniref:DoxX family protein n=1 Tax=Fulvitalea axinellae TaxID=1182444 RepID=A0AAU9D947_9BACT|nr:hypothetical protein FUAX_49200 [Fulvitalea axinellae]
MKAFKIIFWISTLALSALMLFSAYMYFTDYEMVAKLFVKFGYPSAIVYPLAVAKILGVVAVISRKSNLLKNLAYLGFFIDLVLAIIAHVQVQDGQQSGAIMGLVLVLVSYFSERKAFAKA